MFKTHEARRLRLTMDPPAILVGVWSKSRPCEERQGYVYRRAFLLSLDPSGSREVVWLEKTGVRNEGKKNEMEISERKNSHF